MNKPRRSIIFCTFVSLLAVSLLLPGCSAQQQANGFNGYRGREFKQEVMEENNQRKKKPSMRELAKRKGERSQTEIISPHNNTRMEWNPYLDQQIAAMEQVRTARTIVTDSYVYVSVELEEQAKRINEAAADGNTGKINQREEPYREQTPPEVRSGVAGNSHDFDLHSTNSARNHAGHSINGKLGAHPEGELHSSSSDSDLSNMPVAIRQQIVQKVRDLSSPALHHVFVSANDEFRAQINKLAEMEKQGQTHDQLVPALNSLATRFFPDLNGTGSYGGSSSGGKIGRPISSGG